jgi:hypothetical protein
MICSLRSFGMLRIADNDRLAPAMWQTGSGVLPCHGARPPGAFLGRDVRAMRTPPIEGPHAVLSINGDGRQPDRGPTDMDRTGGAEFVSQSERIHDCLHVQARRSR